MLLNHLYELVGKQTVLLVARPGEKRPKGNGQQNVELEQTLEPYYQDRLKRAALRGNVCARLGRKSGGLLSVDLDLDEPEAARIAYESLVVSMPWMAHTLTTRGRPNRCQIWFRVLGEFPRTNKKLLLKNAQGVIVGELRNGEGNQWQNVLSGLHPITQKPYTFLIEEPVKEIPWPEFELPPGWSIVEAAEETTPPAPGMNDGAAEGASNQGGGAHRREWWLKYPGCNFSALDLPGLLQTLGVKPHKSKDSPGWWNFRCPWADEHTQPDPTPDAGICPPDAARGVWWAFHCFHAHCAGRGLEQVVEWAEAREPGIVKRFCGGRLAELILPSGTVPYTVCARKLWSGLAPLDEYFVRAGIIVEISRTKLKDAQWHEGFSPLDAASLRSRIDRHFHVLAWRVDKSGHKELREARCPNDAATVLLKTLEARELLPIIYSLSSCPMLTGEPGNLRVLGHGYHPECGGVYVLSRQEIQIPPIVEAKQIFAELLCDYQFVTPSDRSRAIASFISPALRAGGLLGDVDFPLDVAEADQSQSGKTYRQKLVCAVYGAVPYLISQRTGGVGSLDESLSSAIDHGVPFILIDNFRGRVNSPILESALRGIGFVNVRVPHRGEIQLPTGYLNWMLSSNGIEGGRDFANRTIVTAIRKQPAGYKFKEWEGKDILARVKAEQERYLGAVFSVIREWDAAGRPQTSEARHEFREWAQPLDWMVQNLFGLAKLVDGHQEEVMRVSGPSLSWLRSVAIALDHDARLPVELEADAIVNLCEVKGIEIPGSKATFDQYQLAMQAGRLLGQAFATDSQVSFDRYQVTRRSQLGPQRRNQQVYGFITV